MVRFTIRYQTIDHPPSLMGMVYWHVFRSDGVKVNGGISLNQDQAERDAVIAKYSRASEL